MKPDSMDLLDVIVELRKRHAVEITEDDYMQLAVSDSHVACLGPRPQGP